MNDLITNVRIKEIMEKQIISPFTLIPIIMAEEISNYYDSMLDGTTMHACSCSASCGSNFSKNGTCTCSSSCGSNYSY